MARNPKLRNMLIDDDLWERLKVFSAKKDLSASWVIRQAIEEYMENHPGRNYIIHEDKVKYNVRPPGQEE